MQVFRDPYFGTPLFFTALGASSCPNEKGTAKRSAPAISSTYSGPAAVGPHEPLIFEVELRNTNGYYEGGPEKKVTLFGKEKDRPRWSPRDLGYSAPDMALSLNGPLADGLQLSIDGQMLIPGASIIYSAFAEGSQLVTVEVWRGPLENQFQFPSPVLKFDEACSDGTSEHHPTCSLGMTGDGSGIRFKRECGEYQTA